MDHIISGGIRPIIAYIFFNVWACILFCCSVDANHLNTENRGRLVHVQAGQRWNAEWGFWRNSKTSDRDEMTSRDKCGAYSVYCTIMDSLAFIAVQHSTIKQFHNHTIGEPWDAGKVQTAPSHFFNSIFENRATCRAEQLAECQLLTLNFRLMPQLVSWVDGGGVPKVQVSVKAFKQKARK